MSEIVLCDDCGHRAQYHTSVGRDGYSSPWLSCTFETDRYEVCRCDKLKLDRDKLLEIAVKHDDKHKR